MYQAFRQAVGIYLCFSPVAMLCLMVGASSPLMLLFGLIPGLAFAGISYVLMFHWDDFDRIVARLFKSNRITLAEISTIKSLLQFIAAYILYSMAFFILFQPHGFFLAVPFMGHLIMGIMPVLAIYIFKIKRKLLPSEITHLSEGRIGVPINLAVFLITLPCRKNKKIKYGVSLFIFLILSLIIPIFSLSSYINYNSYRSEPLIAYITVFFIMTILGYVIFFTAIRLLNSFDNAIKGE